MCVWRLLILYLKGRYSSVGIATRYGLDGPGSNPGGDEIFRPSRPAPGPTQPPAKWAPGLSSGCNTVGTWCEPPIPISLTLKKEWSYTSNPSPPWAFIACSRVKLTFKAHGKRRVGGTKFWAFCPRLRQVYNTAWSRGYSVMIRQVLQKVRVFCLDIPMTILPRRLILIWPKFSLHVPTSSTVNRFWEMLLCSNELHVILRLQVIGA